VFIYLLMVAQMKTKEYAKRPAIVGLKNWTSAVALLAQPTNSLGIEVQRGETMLKESHKEWKIAKERSERVGGKYTSWLPH
jgi:hypothetical protein